MNEKLMKSCLLIQKCLHCKSFKVLFNGFNFNVYKHRYIDT